MVLLPLMFYTGEAPAQISTPQIEPYFKKVGELKQLNGNILLADNDKIVLKRSYGYADYDSFKPNNEQSRYNLASISKLFTSTAILQLKDRDKLKLDDSLIKYLPDFPYADITIRHLLTHTSGLADLELFEDLIKKYPDTVVTNKNVLPELKKWKRGLYFKPGDQFRYCNTEYSLLALLVEKIEGIPFEKYLKENIFKKAGMNDTYVSIYPNNTVTNDHRAVKMNVMPHPYYDTTYTSVDNINEYKYTNYNNSGTIGQSNVITTTSDLQAFDKAFFAGKLIKPSTMEEAFTPVKLNNGQIYYSNHMDTMSGEGKGSYGLGWEIFEQPVYGKSVGHGGFKFGLATFYFRNLERKQTVIGFDNTAGSEFGRVLTSALYLLNNNAPMELRTDKSAVRAYGTALVKHDIDYAITVFNELKTDSNYYLSEWEINNLGYDLLYKSSMPDHKVKALEAFKVATIAFPQSFNTYDSYAQALAEVGKKEEAIRMYKKAIVMNPDNEDGKRALKRITDSK
jgi:CubicO group peptidase (beta-lactamase class C family)